MSSVKKLMMSGAAGGEEILPEATSFDGVSDYLSRTSTLSGATANKTITMSFWYYEERLTPGSNNSYGLFSGIEGFNSYSFNLYLNGSDLTFYGATDNSGIDFQWTLNRRNSLRDQWNHICFSFDLSNSSNRHVYVNGVSTSVTWNAYQNANMNWANCPKWSIAATSYSYATKLRGRLAHLFVDNSYTNLSVASNLQKFITTDLKPAGGQAALNPLIYLPMTDHTTAGTNEGTGGDFTINGTLAQATRGPNQDNCVASLFDTSDRMYVYNTSIPNGSYFLTSFTLNTESISGSGYVLFHGRIQIVLETSYEPGRLRFNVVNTSGDTIFLGEMRYRPLGKQNHYTFAYDGSTATYQFYENGVSTTFDDISTQTTGTIHYQDSSYYAIGDGSSNRSAIGEFYLDNADIDLSADNPFWDSNANKPKPLRQVLDETGNTPYIAMPLNALDPELNLGTGSQGSASSAPYQSYRGGSEFWARSVDINNIGYLAGSAPTTPTDSKKFTLAIATRLDNNTSSGFIFSKTNDYSNEKFYFQNYNTRRLRFIARNSSNGIVLNTTMPDYTYAADTWYINLICVDLSSTSLRKWYRNGTDFTNTVTWNTYSNDTIDFGEPRVSIGAKGNGDDKFSGEIGFVYFIPGTYIDFSQESNRNLFVDQLGYPRDLSASIEAGDIPEPMVYMKFDDPSNFGINSGTGSNLSVYNTVIAGSDVDY